MNTGGTVGVGEAAYILDQQDEVNDINRQMARIRRSVFDYFYFNSDVITADEAEKFIQGIRGVRQVESTFSVSRLVMEGKFKR